MYDKQLEVKMVRVTEREKNIHNFMSSCLSIYFLSTEAKCDPILFLFTRIFETNITPKVEEKAATYG